jgi:hypothetical protein
MGMLLRRTDDAFHNSDRPLIVSATAPGGVFATSAAASDRRIGASTSTVAERAHAGESTAKNIAIITVLFIGADPSIAVLDPKPKTIHHDSFRWHRYSTSSVPQGWGYVDDGIAKTIGLNPFRQITLQRRLSS